MLKNLIGRCHLHHQSSSWLPKGGSKADLACSEAALYSKESWPSCMMFSLTGLFSTSPFGIHQKGGVAQPCPLPPEHFTRMFTIWVVFQEVMGIMQIALTGLVFFVLFWWRGGFASAVPACTKTPHQCSDATSDVLICCLCRTSEPAGDMRPKSRPSNTVSPLLQLQDLQYSHFKTSSLRMELWSLDGLTLQAV